MVADIAGYRYADLLKSRIISSRSDLFRKQRDLGFPKAVKIGDRSAWWPADEVRAWLQGRIALRDGGRKLFRAAQSPCRGTEEFTAGSGGGGVEHNMRRRGQEFAIIGDSIEDCNTGRVVGKLTLGLPLSY